MSLVTSTRQWQTSQNGISNLRFSSAPLSQLKSNEVLVKISTVSLNYRDADIAEGAYLRLVSTPDLVPCSDACGQVVAVGQDVTKWKPEDRVLSLPIPDYLTGQIEPQHLMSGLGGPSHGESAVPFIPLYAANREQAS